MGNLGPTGLSRIEQRWGLSTQAGFSGLGETQVESGVGRVSLAFWGKASDKEG